MCAHSRPAEETLSAVPAAEALGPRVLTAATEAGIDPFMLAALVFTQSDCKPSLDAHGGYGLLRIAPEMYKSEGAPSPPGDKEAWTKKALLDPVSNLRLGAQLLKMWQDAHLENDEEFKGVAHRGAVAHFVWGDIVRGSGNEDQTYTARRRLIGFTCRRRTCRSRRPSACRSSRRWKGGRAWPAAAPVRIAPAASGATEGSIWRRPSASRSTRSPTVA